MGSSIELFTLSTVIGTLLIPLIFFSVLDQKPGPDTKYSIKNEYDYIIVGGGSAGAVLANRLSELECATVLLLEAGPSPTVIDNVPLFGRFRFNTAYDWAYKTVPQKHTASGLVDRKIIYPLGRGLGGSSLLNAMLYVRGCKDNYDVWEKMGAEGWGFKDVFPYFLKLENYRNPKYLSNGYHNVGGPVYVERPRYTSSAKQFMVQAANESNYEFVDVNAERMTGFYDQDTNTKNGERFSTAKAYLVPAENRQNLDIVVNAAVTKIIIENSKALGVVVEHQLQKHRVSARKEVILSAGTIHSPQLLMVSGVGPSEHLKSMGIHVHADLPVGNNLQDHLTVPMMFQLDNDPKPAVDIYESARDYTFNRSGILSSTHLINVMAFLNTETNSTAVDLPNIALYFLDFNCIIVRSQFGVTEKVYNQVYKPYEKYPVFLCWMSLVQPRSKGTIRLQSPDPHDPPLIDPNYYSDEDDLDLKESIKGMKLCSNLITSRPMREGLGAHKLKALYPGCEKFAKDEDKYFECMARTVVITTYHPVGTVRMGRPDDPETVLDTQLRVKGIKGLRVVDASIMPKIVSANTNVPTIMIAEKASDIIKNDFKCSKSKA